MTAAFHFQGHTYADAEPVYMNVVCTNAEGLDVDRLVTVPLLLRKEELQRQL
jgi:hypothetical protein